MIAVMIDFQNFLIKKENTFIQHFLFWILVTLVVIVFREYPNWLKDIEIVCFIIQFLAFIAIPGYINNSLILPFFKKKKIMIGIALYIVQLLILIFAMPYILNWISAVFKILLDMKNAVQWENENITFNVISFTIMASIVNVAKERYVLQKEKKDAELRQLKEQLNPHFLFNTLNNLYGLSVIKSDKLPNLMLKLSDLLRYSLYETNNNLVSLEKELIYIKNYVELEKIRLEERTEIQLNISGNFTNYSIAPLMLIVFIENSFKHHSSKRNKQGMIKINFSINEGIFEMSLTNSVDPSMKNEVNERKTGGIGLPNVKKRLDLIYGEKHKLDIHRKEELYMVELKIDLTS